MSDVTRILSQIEAGDPTAADKLLPLVYNELRKLAAARLVRMGANLPRRGTPAETATLGVFDTVGWHEVISRLARASGLIRRIAQLISDGRIAGIRPSVAEAIVEVVAQVETDAKGLLKQLHSAAPGTRIPVRPATERSPVRYSLVGKMGSNGALGQLRAASRFVAKCRRDAPRIEANGGAVLTDEQRSKILDKINVIRTGVSRLRYEVRSSE